MTLVVRLVLVAGLAVPCLAHAQVFADAALESLWQADRHTELDRVAQQRVAARPDDVQAVLASAWLALRGDDALRRQTALAQAERCLELQARAAPCHYALGLLLSAQAMSEGMLKAMGSMGRIRSALKESFDLAPAWFPARSAWLEYLLQAPALAGGSVSQARELARGAAHPEQAKALQARIHLHEEQWEQALRQLLAVKPGADSALSADVRDWQGRAGFGLLTAGEPDKARPAFERLAAERPGDALPVYGLARVTSESGQPQQALALYERAAQLRGAERLPIDYRLGIAQQALDQKDAARLSFRRALTAGRGSQRTIDDLKKRLAQLGG